MGPPRRCPRRSHAGRPCAVSPRLGSHPDSRLMRKSKQHEYRQAYNAQAVVDAGGSQLIVGARVTNCASDRNELVADIAAIPAVLGRPATVLADNGYANGDEVAALAESDIEALVATGSSGRRRRYDFRAGEETQGRMAQSHGRQARQRGRPCAVPAAPADRRAGLRHHQGGARLASRCAASTRWPASGTWWRWPMQAPARPLGQVQKPGHSPEASEISLRERGFADFARL